MFGTYLNYYLPAGSAPVPMTPVSHPMGSFVGVIHVLQPVNYNRLYLVTVNSIIDYVSLLLIYIYFIYCWVIIIILSCKAIVIYIYIYG